MTEPDRKLRRSFVVYDKRTGELVGAHQISVAEGADLPATSDLLRLVLRTAATDKRSSARLAVLEHGSAIADPSRYSVNIRTGRLVEKRRAPRPRRSPRRARVTRR